MTTFTVRCTTCEMTVSTVDSVVAAALAARHVRMRHDVKVTDGTSEYQQDLVQLRKEE